jgi:high affinity Mn2+ porin
MFFYIVLPYECLLYISQQYTAYILIYIGIQYYPNEWSVTMRNWIFPIIVLILPACCLCHSGESVEEMLKKMQLQISELQGTVKVQNLEISHLKDKLAKQEKSICQISDKQPPTDKPAEEDKSFVLGNISIGGGLTGIVQGTEGNDDNANINTGDGKGDRTDGSWSGDIELESKLGERGTAFVLLEAGNGDGLQEDELLVFHGVNDDNCNSDADFEATEAWYEHAFLNDRLLLTVGKIDTTCYLDGNAVANDETAQFLSCGFVNSIAVEWPEDNGLGSRLTYRPNDLLDLTLCIAEADAEWEDAFDDPFMMCEVCYKPVSGGELQGNYRLYTWFNGSDKEEIDGDGDNEDGHGFGISIDQQIHPLVTLFGRVGWEDDDVYEVEWAWSCGGQLCMNCLNRHDDFLGVAFGQAITNDKLYLDDESHLEIYYSIQLTDYLAISPHFQYFWNPLGDDIYDDFAVLGVRSQISF